MQFNSFLFILCFLPLVLLGYFTLGCVHPVWSKFVLIGASLFFYAYAEPRTLLPLGLSLLVNYIFSKLLESEKLRWRRFFLAVPVCINAALLLYFKYLNFAITNYNALFHTDHALKTLLLPVGISFFTFQQIAYLVSVYRKELLKADLIDYLAYITYFPKLLMGPLMEPVDFVEQLNDLDRKKINWDNLACGVKIFSFGLFKKVMLADTFAAAVAWGYSNLGVATAMDWLLVMLFYTFEIYFDFSGYSDMAVGVSMMLNIDLPINFDSPYKALSIRDFWKRWHISLTKFFTKYVYIPLGGSRKGLFFTYLNTMIIFVISGIWHGANWTFLLWGILHGLMMVFDRIFGKLEEKIFEPVRWAVSFFCVNVLWLLFRSDSIGQWKQIIKTIAQFNSTSISEGLLNSFVLPEAGFLTDVLHIGRLTNGIHGFWMLSFVFGSLLLCLVPENNYKKRMQNSGFTMLLAAVAFVWSFICLSAESVFVYFNF